MAYDCAWLGLPVTLASRSMRSQGVFWPCALTRSSTWSRSTSGGDVHARVAPVAPAVAAKEEMANGLVVSAARAAAPARTRLGFGAAASCMQHDSPGGLAPVVRG